jgi:hypothetical protein
MHDNIRVDRWLHIDDAMCIHVAFEQQVLVVGRNRVIIIHEL